MELCRWGTYLDVVFNATDPADCQSVPYDANALGLDSCSLFLVAIAPQDGLEIEWFIGRDVRFGTSLFDIGSDLVLATLAALGATQSTLEVACPREFFVEFCEFGLGTGNVHPGRGGHWLFLGVFL